MYKKLKIYDPQVTKQKKTNNTQANVFTLLITKLVNNYVTTSERKY